MATAARPTPRIISSDEIKGATVHDASGKEIGKIEDVMIDKASGDARYALVDFCEFMCIRHGHHPVPWSSLKYDGERDRYTADITAAQLEAAPDVTAESWTDPEWEARLRRHYSAQP